MFPSGYSIKERPLGALPDIINIKKKRTAAFNISLFIDFNLGLLLCLIPCYLPPVSILYQDFCVLLLYIDAIQNDLAIELSLILEISSLVEGQ
jgi:uncharacterized protein with PQ loop repeat